MTARRPTAVPGVDPLDLARMNRRLNEIALSHAGALARDHGARWQDTFSQLAQLMRAARLSGRHATPADWAGHWRDYLRDSAERAVLAADILRQRADALAVAEDEGAAPALSHAAEPVMDGETLPRPCNAQLVRLVGAGAPDPDARPVLLLCARAGQGAGLDAAAAAAALRAGHPTYAVAHARVPLPGQTVADIADACAAFAAAIAGRHPDAPAPLVLGQGPGGWMPLVLAASHPGAASVVVLDGVALAPAPGRAPWPAGGGAVAALLSDLGGGLHDAATPAFEAGLSDPAAAWLRPHARILTDADRAGPRVIEAARRGGGHALLTAAEARWAAEALPPGDRLARNAAALGPGRALDLRAIRAPMVICARPDDPATRPAQALGWLRGTWADAAELRAAGQRVVAMTDPAAGPELLPGGTVAGVPAFAAIEALAPGLYALTVERRGTAAGGAELALLPVDFDDLAALAEDPEASAACAAAARAARLQAEFYDAVARPLLRAAIAPQAAAAIRAFHPMRAGHAALSSRAPWTAPVATAAARVRADRQAAAPDNPFLFIERMTADLAAQWVDLACGMRDATAEMSFHALWGNPWARAFAGPAAVPAATAPDDRAARPPAPRLRKTAGASGAAAE